MYGYVAFAAPHNVGGPLEAYNRQYTRLDINALINELPPAGFKKAHKL